MVKDLIEGTYEDSSNRYAAAVMFRIGLGKRANTGDEPYVQRII